MTTTVALRVWDEFLFVVRREGLAVSTDQAAAAMRALALLGLDDPWTVREALAAVLVHTPGERALFERVFREHFRPGLRGRTLWQRLEAAGLSASERSVVADWLRAHDVEGGVNALVAWLDADADRDHWLARSPSMRVLQHESERSRVGYLVHRVLQEAKLPAATAALGALDLYLRDALGAERAGQIAGLLRDELTREEQRAKRALGDRVLERSERDTALRTPLAELAAGDVRLADRAVARLAERLVAKQRMLETRARRGSIDLRTTRRYAKRTLGIPMVLARRHPRKQKSRLLVLCDVSDSVRAAARYLLLFLYRAQKLWADARTFVFVSDVAETTEVFRREGPERALALAYGGSVVATSHNSNYGRALAQFSRLAGTAIDRNTSVVVLGDGRSNFLDPGLETLAAIRQRARSITWFCPEPEASWGRGDSRMLDYRARVTHALAVATLEELERAVMQLPRLR